MLAGVLAVAALAATFRWGFRSGRLRAEHGEPPAGAVRHIYRAVTIGYVAAAGGMVWWLLGDLLRPGWLQLLVAEAAAITAFAAGRRAAARG